MNLEEAIEGLREILTDGILILDASEKSVRLGIEALEKVVALRKIFGMPLPLPSEEE